jgi:hypothetical protein
MGVPGSTGRTSWGDPVGVRVDTGDKVGITPVALGGTGAMVAAGGLTGELQETRRPNPILNMIVLR